MAISFKKQYLSEADFAYDLASSTNKLFDKNDYDKLAEIGLGTDYAYTLADIVSKTSDSFDLGDYNLLSDPIDKLTYITTHYYTSKDTTATDEETGETYNVFERNNAYLQQKIQQQIDKNTYDSLDFFGKVGASIVGFVGNAFSQAYNIVENIIDVGAFVGETGARLFGDVEAAENIREFAAGDFTGAGAFQNAIDRFNTQYTVWDKSTVTKAILDIQSSIVRMAPLALNVVAPGVGSVAYYGTMAGQSYADVVKANPDISYGNLLAYLGGSVAIEAGTEWLSSKVFGSDTFSRWIFGGKGETRTAFKALGMDMFTEGLEEGVAEIFGSLLYKATIDPSAELAGIDDIFYASVLGALTGGIMTGGNILTTTRFGLTQDGRLITSKQAKEEGVEIKKFGPGKSYNIKSALNAQLQTVSEVQKLNNKYATKNTTEEQLREIETQHAKEYEKARKKDNENQQKAALDAVKIAKFLEAIGVEKFKKASELLENNLNATINMVENWQNHQKGVDKFQQAALAELEAANPGVTININETLTGDEKALAKALKEAYGVDLVVGEWASADGQKTFGDLKTTNNYVFLESGSLASRGYQAILDEVISKQLVSDVLNTPGLLTDKNMQKLLKVIANNLKTTGEITNEVKSDIASMLLFDDITINKVFYSDSNLFVKMARWAKNAISKNRMQKKTEANKIEFNKLLKIRQRYIDSVAKSIGNKEDVAQATKTMDLSMEEADTILSQMQRNVTNHILLMSNDLSARSVEFKTAQLKLVSSKADGNVDTDIDYTKIYDTTYWTEAFVKEVMTFYPDYSFADALDYYCMDKLGFVLSQRNQTMYKVVNMADSEEASKKEFLMAVEDAMVTNDISHIKKYTKPSDIFTKEFLSVFNQSDLDKITIKYDQLANKQGQTFVDDNGNITITINSSVVYNAQKIIYHEMAHAFGKIMGFPTGTSKSAMTAVANSMSDLRLRALAEKLFGKEFSQNANRTELVSEVASALYDLNEGERYANGDPVKFTRDFDGFRIHDGYVFGLGKYEYTGAMRFMVKIPDGVETRTATYETVSSKFSKETGITVDNAKQQGFSNAFIELLEKDAATKNNLWALIDSNSVGTPEATNKIISWLAPNNKTMKTIEDVEKAKVLGIPYAIIYGKAQQAKDPEYNKKARPSFDKLTRYFENRPQAMDKVLVEQEKLAKQLDRPENSTINSWLIKNDYGYSLNKTNSLISALRGQYGLSSEKATVSESTASTIKGEEGELSKLDILAEQQWRESQSDEGVVEETYSSVENYIKTMRELTEKLGDSEQVFTIRNKIKNDRTQLIKAFGEDGYKQILAEAPKTKDSYYDKIKTLKTKLAKIDLTSEEKTTVQINHRDFTKPSEFDEYISKLNEIVEKHKKKSAEEAILSKTDEGKVVEKKEVFEEKTQEKPVVLEKERAKEKSELASKITSYVRHSGKKVVYNPDSDNFVVFQHEGKALNSKGPSVLMRVKTETELLQKLADIKAISDDFYTSIVAQYPFLKNEKEQTKKEEKPVVETKKEVSTTPKEKKSSFKEKPILKGKSTDDIVKSILEPFKTVETAETETQFSEATEREHTKVSYNMIDELSVVLLAVNDSNYDEVRENLKASKEKYSDQALMIFDTYTWEMRHRYGPETVTKIENINTKQKSLAGQQLYLQAQRVMERNPASEMVGLLKKKGFDVRVSDEMVLKHKKELENKDAYIKKLNDKIEKLENQLKETTNKLEAIELNSELKEVVNEKFVMENGTNEDIMNWIMTHTDDLNLQTKISDDLLRDLLETGVEASEKGKKIKTILYDKNGNPIPFPKAREMIMKSLKATRSYRMWAMLSSPVTWVRNWIGNKGMQALDGVTNAFERFLSSKVKFGEQQLKYNDTRAGKEVYDHIGEIYGVYIKGLINGESSKYDDVDEALRAAKVKRELLMKQAREATGFKKLLAQVQNIQQWGLETGPLGDQPMVFASICKNMGNLVASNSEYLLTQIKDEAEKLKKKTDLSETQEARLLLLNRAIESKNATDIFDAMPKEEMIRFFEAAKGRSFEQYFKNTNAFSKWCTELGRKNPILGEIVSWIMPFPKVATNILKMSFRYSPLNFVKAISQWNIAKQINESNEVTKEIKELQKKKKLTKNEQERLEALKKKKTFRTTGFETSQMVRSFSEASVGTFLLLAGVLAGALGWVDIDEDDYMGPSLRLGDIRIGLSNLAPSLTTFSTAAAMIWAFKNDKNPITQGLSALYDNTLLGNIDNILSYGSSGKFIENTAISYLGQYIPAVVKLVNKWTTNSAAKDKTGPFLLKVIKTLGSYVPGLSSLVPDKINPYTGAKAYSTRTEDWFFNFFASVSPLTVTTTNRSALEAEAERYKAETTGLSGKLTINGKDITVSGKTKENLAKYRAEYINKEFALISSGKQLVTVEDENGKRITTTYNKLTDKQKASVLNNLYSKATDISKIKYWIDQGNYYIVTDKTKFNQYKKLFNSSRVIYKKSWSKSKFVEK